MQMSPGICRSSVTATEEQSCVQSVAGCGGHYLLFAAKIKAPRTLSVFCDQLPVVAPRRAEAGGPSGEHHSEVCWSRTPSQLVSNISRNGDSTPSLGNLMQCLTTLTVKKCFLMFNHYMPCSSLFPLPPIFSLGTQE